MDRKLGATTNVGGRLPHFALFAPRTSVACFTSHSRLRYSQSLCSVRRLRDRAILIGTTAIRNRRIPLKQHAPYFSNRSRIACLRAPFVHVLHPMTDQLNRSSHPFLIATAAKLKIELTRSQQTRNYFLIATFSACSAHASPLAALTTLHPSPTMKSMPCILPQDALHFSAVADHGSLITNHQSLITGHQNV